MMNLPVDENETEILARLKFGDPEAFLEIYNRYHSQLYFYVLRFVKINAMAEDVIHDVFLKLWEFRKNIRPELSVKGYLYKISRNLVFKLMKKIASDTELRNYVERSMTQLGDDPGMLEKQEKYAELLENAIKQLPAQRQRVFKLCRLEGKTYEETASILGISKYTVKEHMVLSMKFLRKYFENNQDLTMVFIFMLNSCTQRNPVFLIT